MAGYSPFTYRIANIDPIYFVFLDHLLLIHNLLKLEVIRAFKQIRCLAKAYLIGKAFHSLNSHFLNRVYMYD